MTYTVAANATTARIVAVNFTTTSLWTSYDNIIPLKSMTPPTV